MNESLVKIIIKGISLVSYFVFGFYMSRIGLQLKEIITMLFIVAIIIISNNIADFLKGDKK